MCVYYIILYIYIYIYISNNLMYILSKIYIRLLEIYIYIIYIYNTHPNPKVFWIIGTFIIAKKCYDYDYFHCKSSCNS